MTTLFRNRGAVLLFTVIVFCWGLYALTGLTIEAFPDPSDTQVNVITRHEGQSPEEIERQISIPIERAANGIPGLARTRSINLLGLSYVTLTFRDGIDVLQARAQTLERLRLVNLPEGVVPTLGSLSTPIGEIYRYTLVSDQPDPMALRTLQDWLVRPQLLAIDGIADVTSYGGLVKQVDVRPDPIALASRGLTLQDLEDALSRASENASGGVLERGSEQLVIRSEGLWQNINDVRKVVVGERSGTPVYLTDVASVRIGWAPRQGIVGRGLDGDAIEGIVLMRRGERPAEVLARLRKKVEELNHGALPNGTHLAVFYDRGELIDQTLVTVGRNLAEGAALVVLVLFVCLMDLRAALICAALIPLSLLVAFIYLSVRGMSANLLSMGAVDFGVIVDGAVVMVEAIVSRITAKEHLGSTEERIKQAMRDVLRPTIFALLIIIAAYLPIFLLERVEGRIFGPMAHTVVAALLGSLMFSLTLVPVLAAFAYRRPRPHRESPLLVAANDAYLPLLKRAMNRPWLVMGSASLLMIASVVILARRGTEFLPELNEGSIYLTITLPPNTSLAEGRRLTPAMNEILDRFPEVEGRISQLGRPEDGTDPKLANNLEIFVKLRPMKDWPKGETTLGALMDRMQVAFAAVPGIEVNFSQPIRDNVNDSIAGQQGQVALKFFGSNLTELQAAAEQAHREIAEIAGATDVAIVKSGEQPRVVISPRRDQLGRFGLSMDDVQRFLATALGGRIVGELWEEERVFDLVLRLPATSRDSVEQLAALRIPTRKGALIPLASVADIHEAYGRAAISRENGQRYVGVRMNVRGRDLGSFVTEAQTRVHDKVKTAAGITSEWGGEFESKERAMHRLLVLVPIAIAATLMLLYYAFGSLSLALLVLANVPFALIGGAIGLWLVDLPISISAAVGFIALVGQASLNGVLVLSSIEQRRVKGVPLGEAVVEGAGARLRAVLMTAALAALGLFPAALSRAMGAEMQRPIAVVIVGGTLSAALLTLFVLPVSYYVIWAWRARTGKMNIDDDHIADADEPADDAPGHA